MPVIAELRRRLGAVILPRPSAGEWDRAFAAGRWDFLLDPAESARLAVAAHYVRLAGAADAAILDVGCGEGLLADLVAHLPFRDYLGVDLSAVAIGRARAREGPRTRFLVADAADYVPPAPPGIVALNEVLYYFPDPEATVRRLLAAMPPGGALIVSIYDKPKTRRLWRMLRRLADPVDAVSLRNAQGTRWRIGWFARR